MESKGLELFATPSGSAEETIEENAAPSPTAAITTVDDSTDWGYSILLHS